MTKTDLFIERVKLFKNKDLREKTFENMDKKTQKKSYEFNKKRLDFSSKIALYYSV